MIKPTVGRVVWFVPEPHADGRSDPAQPYKADVVYVHDDTTVNLSVIDHQGRQFPRIAVRLLQDDEVALEGQAHAKWMPFQVGQAKAQTAAPAAP